MRVYISWPKIDYEVTYWRQDLPNGMTLRVDFFGKKIDAGNPRGFWMMGWRHGLERCMAWNGSPGLLIEGLDLSKFYYEHFDTRKHKWNYSTLPVVRKYDASIQMDSPNQHEQERHAFKLVAAALR